MSSSLFELHDPTPWARFVSRCALATAVAVVGLVLTFVLALGMDPSAPPEYAELVQASRRLGAFRLVAVLDTLVWLGIGTTLLSLGVLLIRAAPLRAVLIAACGLGQLAGVTGGYLRIVGTAELASRYAGATADEQAQVVLVYLPIVLSMMSHYGLGQLLHGVGFLLVAVVAPARLGLPRWLAVWLGLLGAYSVGSQVLAAAGVPLELGPLFLVYLVLGLGGAHLALGLVLWRRTLRGALRLSTAPAR